MELAILQLQHQVQEVYLSVCQVSPLSEVELPCRSHSLGKSCKCHIQEDSDILPSSQPIQDSSMHRLLLSTDTLLSLSKSCINSLGSLISTLLNTIKTLISSKCRLSKLLPSLLSLPQKRLPNNKEEKSN